MPYEEVSQTVRYRLSHAVGAACGHVLQGGSFTACRRANSAIVRSRGADCAAACPNMQLQGALDQSEALGILLTAVPAALPDNRACPISSKLTAKEPAATLTPASKGILSILCLACLDYADVVTSRRTEYT
jgi:hypothetical protein